MNWEKLLDRLVKEGKLKKQQAGQDQIEGLLATAKRNFVAAEIIKDKVEEAAFKLAYDGLLQLGRAVLLLNGFRPDDGEQHKTTFLVAGEILGKDFNYLTAKIQKFRIKRNDCVYEPQGLITKGETEAIFNTAREFYRKVKRYLEEKCPQIKLFKEF
jgi:hypothetical protein